MVYTVIYPTENAFMGRLAVMTIREHLCGHFEQKTACVDAGTVLDTATGHQVCSACKRITVASGLRQCDICDREFINPNKHQNPKFETNCPDCVEIYGIEE